MKLWVLRLMGPVSVFVMLLGWACHRITIITDRYELWMERKLAVAWAKKDAKNCLARESGGKTKQP